MEKSQSSSNGFAITALVVGIVAFLLGWTGILGLVLAIVALVFGILALTKKQSKGMGITGIALGSVALLTSLFFITVGLAVLGGVAQVADQVSKDQKSVDETKKDFAKGETAIFDTLEVKVKSTPNWTSNDAYITPKDGNEYLMLSLNIKNTSDKTVSVNPFEFGINENGVVSEYDFVAATQTPLNAVELKPGATLNGDLVYQVKKGATGLKLEYKHYNEKALKEVTYTLAL
jgi:hypothetical protein